MIVQIAEERICRRRHVCGKGFFICCVEEKGTKLTQGGEIYEHKNTLLTGDETFSLLWIFFLLPSFFLQPNTQGGLWFLPT